MKEPMEISRKFKNWLDRYGQNRSERKYFQKREYIESLSGMSLLEIVEYVGVLKVKYGDVVYDEHWTGYEDMSPSVVWWEEESDEDYDERIKELHKKFLAERQEVKKQQERGKIEEEIYLLKSRLNSL